MRDLVAFPDHHAYAPGDLEAVARRARAVGASLLVTTEKDAVRLAAPAGGRWAGAGPLGHAEAMPPVWALRIRLEPVSGAEEWRAGAARPASSRRRRPGGAERAR